MVDEEILAFLRAIDDELARSAAAGEVLSLYLLGRSALVLGFGVRLMTKDVDVVHVHDSGLLDRALALFGAGTDAAFELELRVWPRPAQVVARVDPHGNTLDWRLHRGRRERT